MKTEDVRMTEIALGPFSSLIVFSMPERDGTIGDTPLVSEIDVPIFGAPVFHDTVRREENRCISFAHEV